MSIALKNVSFVYMPGTPFEHKALDNINVEIGEGEFVGIIGHTGCGKSTLIQVMAGLITPTEGQVLLDGENILEKEYDRKKLRRKVGVVFQYPEYQLFEETVKLDVAFGPTKAGFGEEEIEEKVKWALDAVGCPVEEYGEYSPFELSGGQKRKIAIAGVIANKPDILILDEPIAGLDPKGRNEFMDFVKKLNDEGITIIMISHNMDGLCDYASRIIVMNRSQIKRDGTPKEIFSDMPMLRKYGLGASEAREVVFSLQEKGIDIPSDIITLDELCAFLEERLKANV